MMPETITSLGLIDTYLCANGAEVYDASGAVLFSRTMSRENVETIMAAAEGFAARWNVFADREIWIERRSVTYMGADARKVRALLPRSPRQLKSLVKAAVRRVLGEPGKHDVTSVRPAVKSHDRFDKVGCTFATMAACDEACARIDGLGRFEVARVWGQELEITARGVSKGTTADWLHDHFGIERERSVAFGDSQNDASLIGHVGRFVAMGNADDALKHMADEVCKTLMEDGVAMWLREQLDEAQGRT